MALLLALSLASTAFLISSAAASTTYLKFLRRFTLPSCCSKGSISDGSSIAAASISGSSSSKNSGKPFPTVEIETVHRFRWREIELFTDAFTSVVIGEGGFSTVYLGRLHDSSLAAVKLYHSGSSERLLRAFRQEVDVLLRLSHPRIVRLLGYSDHGENCVLVFEYVPGGTLRDRLHGEAAGGAAALPWARRLSIALNVAEAVDYLHEGGDLPIIHGDITAANVLLDDRRGPKLCDFGSSRVGFSAGVKPAGNPIVGSPGYTDPYYMRTGIVSKKSDVYSFGVLLLELITGRPAFSTEEGGALPLAVALRGAAGRVLAVDPIVAGGFNDAEAVVALGLAALCVGDQPSLRPTMAEVIRVMTERLPSSITAVKSDGFTEM